MRIQKVSSPIYLLESFLFLQIKSGIFIWHKQHHVDLYKSTAPLFNRLCMVILLQAR
ncbi:hypothetical protein [Brevibacillus laterosporus]|uniref:hypothetical protein n=1 Tax=Brevibacillus laterosporus TaxID=1465 RepID=UPI00039AD606|nr:hypothetical protein [Brevibacillus laterosporus]NKQ22635.1 hypothetical protein [Brevibacillus laterosporus]WNX30365.1 hypothetical protein RWW94_19430 [Brevibacillus laterosporus]